ncbi:hypothetical protein ACM25N_08885 [Roseovarius sp. C7]|uniref:hypothetical protein n=1 Tax=Roseovarius sp. C7 TaxID=3398643 RepID=UPI0039F712A5
MHPKILFVTYGGGHADIVAELLPSLHDISAPPPVVLALTTAAKRLEGARAQIMQCHQYLPMAGYEDALEIGAALASDLWTSDSTVSWEETCAYLGISMKDLQREIGSNQARTLYANDGRKAFCPVSFMEAVLEREKPDIVVTTCNVRMERAATLAARNLGIRSARIEDLFGYSLLGAYPHGKKGKLIPSEEWPDMVVVMNAAVREILVQHGFPSSRIAALGQPVFASWKNEYEKTMPLQFFEGERKGNPVVTYMATPIDDILSHQTQIWAELARARPDINFLIKLHPSTPETTYREIHGPFPENLRILSDLPALIVIKSSDLVVQFRSTVGLLCVITGTPMIVWDTTGEDELLPYMTSAAVKHAGQDMQLLPMIREALDTKVDASHAALSPLFEIPERAGEQIAVWLVNLASEAETAQ